MTDKMLWSVVVGGAMGLVWLAPKVKRRWELSRAKHPSLTGHVRWSKRLARWMPGVSYDEQRFFASDDAPPDVVMRRRKGFERLSEYFREKHPRTLAATQRAQSRISDLQLTSVYRVPFQYSNYVRTHLGTGMLYQGCEGVRLIDLDGHSYYDLTGSYGVNVLGHDFYRVNMANAQASAGRMGMILGGLSEDTVWNAEQLCRRTGMHEVSFHMSGTEAVMQAVRLARYHTGRKKVIRFCGAYHGWWDDVQPGPGNPMIPEHTLTLRDMDDRTLRVLRRRGDIACVLINPLQALHPNRPAPSDSTLMGGTRVAGVDRAAYTEWLQKLTQVCWERDIALILDDVFLGFRIAMGGSMEYFGIQPDLVTYGKTLGGGFPVGVLCGRARWMRRFREERPADLCFARGTFNSHPQVMAAMRGFLEALDTESVRERYRGMDERWARRADQLNEALAAVGVAGGGQVPVRVAHLGSIWTVLYDRTSRYHWMFQYYLRAEGLALSWVGSGRLVFSLNYTDSEFDGVMERFVRAAQAMEADGWWWDGPTTTRSAIRKQMFRDYFRFK